MMSRRRGTRRRRGNSDGALWKAALIAGIPSAILVAGFFWMHGLATDAEFGDDLCLLNRPVEAHTILVIDRTDVIDQVAMMALNNLIERIKAGMEQNERFTLFAIEADRSVLPRPLFSLCNPGTKRQANVIVQTPEKIQRRFDSEFAEPLHQVLRSLSPENEADSSPIMETIAAISEMDVFSSSLAKRKLVMFSDMLQNGTYTHYRGDLDYSHFQDGFPALASVRLNNVAVEVAYVTRKRARALQGNAHLKFWRRYFENAGARFRFEIVG